MTPLRLPWASIYVTAAAARTFGASTGQRAEESRRSLTTLLSDAAQVHEPTEQRPALYRRRSRSAALDVSARIIEDGPLLVVVAVSVRRYGGGGA